MTLFADLFSKFENEHPDVSHIIETIKPYVSKFGLHIDENGIKLDENRHIFIPFSNIRGIQDNDENLYLILQNCIYILCKESGKIKINLR